MRFHAVSAVTGCIGMVNVSGAWLGGGLSIKAFTATELRGVTMSLCMVARQLGMIQPKAGMNRSSLGLNHPNIPAA